MNDSSVSPGEEHSFADDTVSPDKIDEMNRLVEDRCAEITARLDAVLAELNEDAEADE